MANVVEIVLKVRDDASRSVQQFEGKLGGLGAGILKLGTSMGVTSAITEQLTQALTQAVGAVSRMPFELANAVEQLDRLSLRSGVSGENLQIMNRVIREAGGNAESLTTATSFLNRAIAEGNPLLAELGITTKDTFKAFMQLADIFANSDDAAKKNWVSFKLLGRGGADLIADMTALSRAMVEVRKAMAETGELMQGDVLEGARDLDKQMDLLSRNWEGAMTRMKAATVPWANYVLEVFNRIADEGPGDIGDTGGGRRARDLFPVPGAKASFGTRDRDLVTGWTADILAGVETGEDKESPRAKRLEELRKVLVGTGLAAERVLKQLEAIEKQSAVQRIVEALDKARPLQQQLDEAAFAGLQNPLMGAGLKVGGTAADPKVAIDELRKVPELQLDALTQVREQWKEFAAELMESATILNDSLNRLWNGLQAGFGTVFANLTSQTQTVRGALTTIFKALVDEILAQLARIAASKVFLWLAGIALGGPAGGAAAGAAGEISSVGIAAAMKAPATGANAGNIVVNVSSLDMPTAWKAATSAFGILRENEIRAAEAYS